MVKSRKITVLSLLLLLAGYGYAVSGQPLPLLAVRSRTPVGAPAPESQAAATKPADPAAGVSTPFGVRVQPLKGKSWRVIHMQYGRGHVVEISEVTAGSAADKMGLKAEDVILSVNYKDITKPEEFADAVSALSPGDKIVLLVSRPGQKADFMEGTVGGAAAAQRPQKHPQSVQQAPGDTAVEAKIFAPSGHHRIISVDISPDGRRILSGGDTIGSLSLWDMVAGNQTGAFSGYTETRITAVAFSADSRYALSAGEDKTVRLWDAATGAAIKTFTGHTAMVLAVAFSPDGRLALSGARDNTLKLWDLSSGSLVRTFTGHSDGIKSIAFSADGKRALSGSFDKTLKLWDIATGRAVRTFTGHEYQLHSVALLPDGRHALSRSGDRVVKLWDIDSGRALRSFTADNVDAAGRPTGSQGIIAGTFSPDGRTMLTTGLFGGTITLWDVAAGKAIRRFTGHMGSVPVVAFSADGRRFVSGGNDGTIRLWDVASGKETAQLISLKNGEWIVLTPEGYYNASRNGYKYLNIHMYNKVYGIEQFYDVFYRPDIVAARLRGDDISGLVTLTLDEAIRNPPPIVEFTAVPSQTDQPGVEVCFQAQSTGGGVGEVRLFHNGKLIASDGYYKEMAKTSEKMQLAAMTSGNIYENMRSIKVTGREEIGPIESPAKGDVFESCKTVDAIAGENEISLAAFNSGNTVQSVMKTATFNSTAPPEAPRLYILSVGIDRYVDKSVSLKYASKDATDIGEKLIAQSATIYEPGNIHHELLADEAATKANILMKIEEISRKIKPSDSFIFFVAGHGVLLQNQYYMLTHDFSGAADERSMISSNEIVEMSKDIKSLSQLFIFDTCHAGGVDYIVSGLYDARMSVLAKKMGLHIYASANDKQAALDGYQGNGLFSHSLLDGLNNNSRADKNKDGKVGMVGLGEYARRVTTTVSRQVGHTQTPLIINFGKDTPIYQLR